MRDNFCSCVSTERVSLDVRELPEDGGRGRVSLGGRLARCERGLTLVEIIVVLIILALVGGFLINRVVGAGEEAKAEITKMKMKDIKSQLEQYRLRYNKIPTSLDSLRKCTEETGPGCIPIVKDDDQLNDAWGNPFLYQRGGDGRTYTIKTLGADGRDGGEGVDYDRTETGP